MSGPRALSTQDEPMGWVCIAAVMKSYLIYIVIKKGRFSQEELPVSSMVLGC